MTKTFWTAAATAALTFVCGWRLGASSASATAREGPTQAALAPLPAQPDGLLAPSAAESSTASDGEVRAPVSPAAQTAEERPFDELLAYWLGRFDEAPDDWRHGWQVAGEIARLEPELALEVMRGVWPSLQVPVKEQVLKPFVFGSGHAAALGVLELALRDAELSVQGRALTYIEWYAFEDFEADYDAALRWMDTWRDAPVGEVLAANAQAFVQRLSGLDAAQLAEHMQRFDLRLRLDPGGDRDLAQTMRDAGIEGLLARALTQGDPQVARNALAWASEVEAGEAWVRTHALPFLHAEGTPESEELASTVLYGLARPECAWASGEVFAWLERRLEDPRAGVSAAASAIAAWGDPTCVPRLIALMLSDTTGRSTYDIGYFGLGKLTGVGYHESHDAAWWQRWWLANQGRFR